MVALLVYAYAVGERSSRRIERHCLSQAGFDGDLEARTICPGGSRGSADVPSEEVPA
jgi:hypothetical protein